MNKQEAMECLSAYIEGACGDQDLRVREALQLAETDPEVREWWKLQTELDPVVREALNQSPVPEGLEAQLLKTVGLTGEPSLSPSGSRKWWLLGMAAAVVLSMSTFFILRRNEPLVQSIQVTFSGTNQDSFDHFRDGMAYYTRKIYFQLDHLTEDLDSIESWLTDKDSPVNETLPEELLALNPIGCKQLEWQEKKVSLICFHNQAGKIVHLFIMDRQNIESSQYHAIENVAMSHNLETGGWTTDSRVYLLVGSDPDVDVEFALG